MDYSEAHAFLKSQGCTFTYDNAEKPVFSETHVFYKGVEFGLMGLHNMAFYSEPEHVYIYQFNYRTMWLGNIDFKEIVARFIAACKDLPEREPADTSNSTLYHAI